jgi:AcrR family transcriptional regulator
MAEHALRELKRQRTRAKIAAAALDLFEANGYEATTLTDIADGVETSTSTIFAYFPGKEDILFEGFARTMASFAGALQERSPGRDTVDVMRAFMTEQMLSDEERRGRRRVVRIAADVAALRRHLRARLAEMHQMVADGIAFDLGVDSLDLRPQIVAAAIVAEIGALFERDDDFAAGEAEAVVDQVVAFVRGGLDALRDPVSSELEGMVLEAERRRAEGVARLSG